MRALLAGRVEARQLHGGSPAARDLEDRRARGRREDDGAVRSPRTSSIETDRAKIDRLSPFHGDLLELPLGEERDPSAVGREEGAVRVFRSGEGRDLELVEPPQVEPLHVPGDPDERESRAIGRDRENLVLRRVGFEVETHVERKPRRQVHRDATGGRRPRAPAAKHGGEEKDPQQGGENPGQRTAPARGGRGSRSRLRRLAGDVEEQARISRVAQAAPHVLLETAAQHAAHRRRRRGRERIPVRLSRDHGGQRVRGRGAVERPAAGQHLVEKAAERPEVGPPVHRLPARLFGTHVTRGPEDRAGERARGRHRPGPREVGARSGLRRLRQPEVEDLHLSVGRPFHVRGLQVPVDHAVLVRRLQRLGDAPGGLESLVHRERAALEALGEVLPGDKLHREESHARP